MSEAIVVFLRVALAGVMACAGLWTAWCVSLRLVRTDQPSVRLCAVAAAWWWLSCLLFVLLSALGMFTAPVATAAWLVAAGAASFAVRCDRPFDALAASAATAWQFWRDIARRPIALLLLLALAVVAVHIVRGMFVPSLAWDDLTYHLFRSARWVQAGRHTIEAAPNQWGYSEYFPPLGDATWAWAMLVTRDDSLLVFANALVLGVLAVSSYAAARSVASETHALIAAALTVTTPSVLHYVPSGYVEPETLAAFTLSVVFAGRLLARPSRGDVFLLSCVLGLGAAFKVSNLAFVVPGVLVVLNGLRRATHGQSSGARLGDVVCCSAALAIGGPFFARAWIGMGSPTYPVPVEIAGTMVFTGNYWQQLIFSGVPPATDDSVWQLARVLFVPSRSDFAAVGQFINPGPGILLAAALAVVGLVSSWAGRRSRALAVYTVAAALLVIASAMQPSVVTLRTVLGTSFGRFLGVPVAAAILWASAARAANATRILAIALVANVALAVPLGWSGTDARIVWPFLLRWLPAILAGALIAFVMMRLKLGRFALAPLLLGWAAGVAAISPVRAQLRYDYYRDAAEGRAFTVNRDVQLITQGWPVWKELDFERPAVIAVAAGWGEMSPMGARYPLAGSRLQSSVTYVPITTNGDVPDAPQSYADPEAADFEAWLHRLMARKADVLVILSPSIEGVWARAHPEIFRAVRTEGTEVYRIDFAAVRPGR